MTFSVPDVLKGCNLLRPDILISHATGSTIEELKLLKDNGVYISCTPGTESQMAHGDLVGFRPDVLGSLGADCTIIVQWFYSAPLTVFRPLKQHGFDIGRNANWPRRFSSLTQPQPA
jgi:hypothetical protein